jgi:hypothetical protein
LTENAKLNLTPGRKRAERNQLSEREREREREKERRGLKTGIEMWRDFQTSTSDKNAPCGSDLWSSYLAPFLQNYSSCIPQRERERECTTKKLG